MTVAEDKSCRVIKLGGYVTKTWFFFGDKREVPVTYAFEVIHRNNVHTSGGRMSAALFQRLSEQQKHVPVYALSIGGRHWWWFQNAFYSTTDRVDPQELKELLLRSSSPPVHGEHQHHPRRNAPPRRPLSQASYALLGLKPDATLEEIKQAYRQRIAEYHPDKVASLGVELRRLAEEMTAKINHAYAELKARHQD